MILPLLLLGGIIYYAVKAGTKAGTQGNTNVTASNSARNIAEERYAKGEISAQELEEIRRNLK